MDNDLYMELEQAHQEQRQPLCPQCHQPLVISETRYRVLVWRWDAEAHQYRKEVLDEGTERPGCLKCDAEFRIFIGEARILRNLGIDY